MKSILASSTLFSRKQIPNPNNHVSTLPIPADFNFSIDFGDPSPTSTMLKSGSTFYHGAISIVSSVQDTFPLTFYSTDFLPKFVSIHETDAVALNDRRQLCY
ncbi:unnamed protein product [Linum trigynum]|uniref:Uncharacterized protein n=1 Tax=Linum trigynum TaxID=586398 RepID=A0AAV2FBD1_9ROSI